MSLWFPFLIFQHAMNRLRWRENSVRYNCARAKNCRHLLYSARPQNALLEIEQWAALGCTSLCSPVLPSNPFPVGHPAVGQSRRHTIHGSPLTKCRVTSNS